VQVAPGDTETAASKARAQTFATFGTASAPMAAAAMLLLYNITLALEIGLAPLFIMCLLFEQTKGLFQKWAMYSIGTLFAMGVLAFISGLVLQLTLRVAGALWTADIINGILDTGAEGFTSQSMQQGGLGLLMTVLVVSAPPIAAMFFQGTMGSFIAYSPFAGGAASRPGPHGQPPGSYGYAYGGARYSPPQTATAQASYSRQTGGAFGNNPSAVTRHSGAPISAHADAIRPAPTPSPAEVG
jgi:type IV secretion system protein VirB6